jgi:dihydrofolate reductase
MGIGYQGDFPWPMLKADLSHFAKITSSKESLVESASEKASSAILFNSLLRKKLLANPAETDR